MKKILALLLSMTMVIVLAACGNSTPAPASTAAPDTKPTEAVTEAPTEVAPETEAPETEPAPADLWVPEKDVTLIVPFNAGGGVDLVGRALADALKNYWGVNVVVENIGGGGSLLGCNEALGRPADGYTLCMMTDSLVISPFNTDNGITKDQYTPLAMIKISSPAMTINADLPYEDMDAFVEAVKAAPGEFNMGTVGARGVWAVFAQAFANKYDLEFTMVPFDTGNDAQLEVAGGHLECTMQNAAEVAEQVKAGNLRCLCVFGDERDAALPDVPTAKEIGYDYSAGSFNGVMVANGIAPEIMDGLNAAIAAAVEDPDFVKFMDSQGIPVTYLNSDDFSQRIDEVTDEFAEIFENWE